MFTLVIKLLNDTLSFDSKQGFVFQQENFRADQPELLKNIQRFVVFPSLPSE